MNNVLKLMTGGRRCSSCCLVNVIPTVILCKTDLESSCKIFVLYCLWRSCSCFSRWNCWSDHVHENPTCTVFIATQSYPVYLTSVLILSFHLCLGLPSGFFLFTFPYWNCLWSLTSSIWAPCTNCLILLILSLSYLQSSGQGIFYSFYLPL
jgi:hypothetical protein